MRNIWTICILIFCLACTKDTIDIIPNVRFSATVELSLQPNIQQFTVRPGGLNNVVGVNGVVVYRTSISPPEYNAFDLMCTHQHNTPGYFYTKISKNDGYMVCPECGSEFEIISEFGSVIKGPAQRALKRYQTSVNGSTLRIWN